MWILKRFCKILICIFLRRSRIGHNQKKKACHFFCHSIRRLTAIPGKNEQRATCPFRDMRHIRKCSQIYGAEFTIWHEQIILYTSNLLLCIIIHTVQLHASGLTFDIAMKHSIRRLAGSWHDMRFIYVLVRTYTITCLYDEQAIPARRPARQL